MTATPDPLFPTFHSHSLLLAASHTPSRAKPHLLASAPPSTIHAPTPTSLASHRLHALAAHVSPAPKVPPPPSPKMHFSLLSLALPLLPLALSSPLNTVPAGVAAPVLARNPTPEPLPLPDNSTLASRTFSHLPDLWGSGGWWGQNDCADASKSSHCFSRGFGWGCNRQCVCVPPPQYDGCKLDHKWRDCRSRGHGWGCDSKCECVPPPTTCRDTIYQDCTSKGKGTSEWRGRGRGRRRAKSTSG